MFKEIKSLDEFLVQKEENAAVLAYFSTEACSVCKVLKPKVEEMVTTAFPKMQLLYVKSDVLPEIAAQNSVFTHQQSWFFSMAAKLFVKVVPLVLANFRMKLGAIIRCFLISFSREV
ncbi:thioredoxin family protein [Draconibacterium orientale]|uniref:thioredoxin family protein n=1 Tax=Draconibacterium orientale TaxID=1168034 RepID=UPI002ABDEB66|nr:thioredoxin family protein [Draconibacterium orientale]